MFARLMCKVLGHKISRRRVRHDGLDFHARCRRCHQDLVRDPDGWHVSQAIDERAGKRGG